MPHHRDSLFSSFQLVHVYDYFVSFVVNTMTTKYKGGTLKNLNVINVPQYTSCTGMLQTNNC